jgi:hypothetical protein
MKNKINTFKYDPLCENCGKIKDEHISVTYNNPEAAKNGYIDVRIYCSEEDKQNDIAISKLSIIKYIK